VYIIDIVALILCLIMRPIGLHLCYGYCVDSFLTLTLTLLISLHAFCYFVFVTGTVTVLG